MEIEDSELGIQSQKNEYEWDGASQNGVASMSMPSAVQRCGTSRMERAAASREVGCYRAVSTNRALSSQIQHVMLLLPGPIYANIVLSDAQVTKSCAIKIIKLHHSVPPKARPGIYFVVESQLCVTVLRLPCMKVSL